MTAVVLTLNEATDIGPCLAAIPSDLPRIVVDSGSTDGTVELSKTAGARIYHRGWTGFADQRNFALLSCDIQTSWVLFIDADERFSTAFFDWMRDVIRNDPPVDCYNVPSILFLDGKALRYAPGYPILHPRLVRRNVRFQVNHSGHGEAVVPCRNGLAPFGYDHYFQSGSLRPWLQKHLGLAKDEADSQAAPTSDRGRLARRIPAGAPRAILRFFYHYVARLGFLDGRNGFRYAVMYAWYELTIYLAGDRK